MGFFDKVGSFVKREAKDLGDAADGVKDKFDQGLTKRERELEMTPSEKIAALQQQAAESDDRFDAIADKATGRNAMADAVAEVGDLPSDASLPNVTHIVLPDGRVKAHDVGQVVDASGTVHDVPLVDAPTPQDLQKTGTATPAAAQPAPVAESLPGPPSSAPPAGPSTPFEFPEPAMPEPPLDLSARMPDIAPPARIAEPEAEAEAIIDELPAPEPEPEPAAIIDEIPAPEPEPEPEPAATIDEIPAPEPEPEPEPAATIDEIPPPEPPPAPEPAAIIDEASMSDAVAEAPDTDIAEATDAPVETPAPNAAADTPSAAPSSPDYGKTPAQIKYELARSAANDLLDELRGELKDDGEI